MRIRLISEPPLRLRFAQTSRSRPTVWQAKQEAFFLILLLILLALSSVPARAQNSGGKPKHIACSTRPADGSCNAATLVPTRGKSYPVGGTISGVTAGGTVTLLDNGGLTVTKSNGSFAFTNDVATYNITVGAQPSGQICIVSNGIGTVKSGAKNVKNVTVKCAAPPDITACDPKGCISESKFSANIQGTLANNVVGYICIVGGLPPVFGGQARTASDAPGTAMSPDLLTNIASVSKTMTATAVLQLLAKDRLTLDARISPFIYPDWHQGPNVNQITFEELLTHTSGFGQLRACSGGDTYAALKALVANGVHAAYIGEPEYGNCNFALLRELMPALSGRSLTNLADGLTRAQRSSSFYISYVNAHILQPVGVPFRECKPPAGADDILSYPFPPAGISGTDWGDWSLECGSGGWVLSANDIFKVINNLGKGNGLLTRDEKKLMFNHCLGWDCAVSRDCPPPYVCKNGDLENASHIPILWTYAGIFKCTVPVVVIVNSPLPSSYQPTPQDGSDIIGLVENAYHQAAIPGTPKPCP
jgi:hypothetical protein